MIIDTHVHIYPDKVAGAIEGNFVRQFGPMYGSFKVSSLLADMDRCGVSTSVVFCIAERPEIVKAANDFVIKVQDNRRLIGMGTIHPDFANYKEEVNRLRNAGIRGIKLSSIFQGFYPDEERMLRIYEAMGEDMIAYFHAGIDLGKPVEEAHTTSERLLRVLELYPKLKVVAAHFGGLDMLDQAEALIGKNLYFDTVWTPTVAELDINRVTRIIKAHGAAKILFGTDYPVTNTQEQIDWISKLPLSDSDKDLIFYKNARRLFNI